MGASQSHDEEQQSQQQLQPHTQSSQPQLHEPIRREPRSLLSPEGNTKQTSKNSSKEVVNCATGFKPNESPSSMGSVKPLNGPIPHNYEYILKDAHSSVNQSSSWGKLLDQLHAGVFLNHKTKKYWVEKKSNVNCFMLYARALSITWSENSNYWKWIQEKEESGTMIELAKLKMVCWLEVHGKFDTRMLSPGILYQVSFIIMLQDSAQGWEIPINVTLVLPRGKKHHHEVILMEKPRESWIEIPIGEFVASEKDDDVDQIEISMYEHQSGLWKTGLLIQGLAIKPKN